MSNDNRYLISFLSAVVSEKPHVIVNKFFAFVACIFSVCFHFPGNRMESESNMENEHVKHRFAVSGSLTMTQLTIIQLIRSTLC